MFDSFQYDPDGKHLQIPSYSDATIDDVLHTYDCWLSFTPLNTQVFTFAETRTFNGVLFIFIEVFWSLHKTWR